MQVEVSAVYMWVTDSAAIIWVIIVIVITQMGISVAIIQVLFSAVHYAQDCFHYYCAGGNNFIFFSLNDSLFS